jgi:hypothetical protein
MRTLADDFAGAIEETKSRLINRLFDNPFSNLGRRDRSISPIIFA